MFGLIWYFEAFFGNITLNMGLSSFMSFVWVSEAFVSDSERNLKSCTIPAFKRVFQCLVYFWPSEAFFGIS